jgi:exosome complex component CSL4
MKVESGDFVMPGDIIGVSEQFLPDRWTYDDGGYIKAAVLGEVFINNSNKKISIIPKAGNPQVLKLGDTIYGQISDLGGQRAMVNIHSLKNSSRQLALPYMGAIHISQVQEGYLERLVDAFRIGDIIEAKVVKSFGDSLDLNTVDEECGVVKGMCSRCRAYMVLTNKTNELYCESCDRKEKRKISSEYDH